MLICMFITIYPIIFFPPQPSPHPPSGHTAHIQQYLSAYPKYQPAVARISYQNWRLRCSAVPVQ